MEGHLTGVNKMTPQARKWLDENKNLTFFDISNAPYKPMTATQVFDMITEYPNNSNNSRYREEPFLYISSSDRPLVEKTLYNLHDLVEIFGIDLA
jgi:hypothetical protein